MKQKIRCKCGDRIKLGPVDLSGKRHGHCKVCKLEWHMTTEGRIYSHIYKQFKKKQRVIKEKEEIKVFKQVKERVKPEYKPSFSFIEVASVD